MVDDGDAVERTEDGRYVVVDGRRWRASDPAIPERLRAELVAELMRARRLVRTRGDEMRPSRPGCGPPGSASPPR